ncbi:MAG: ArsC/Spx/MgsR family protein, partial [Pseudomonadota bacterium]
CDTCKKAIKALEAAGHTVTYIDVRADGVPPEVLEGWLAEHGQAVVNTRSTTWRGLDEAQRLQAESDPVTLLGLHPTLIKRPVIVNDSVVTVGWSKAVQADLGIA